MRRAAWIVFGRVVFTLVAAQLLERRSQVRDVPRFVGPLVTPNIERMLEQVLRQQPHLREMRDW